MLGHLGRCSKCECAVLEHSLRQIFHEIEDAGRCALVLSECLIIHEQVYHVTGCGHLVLHPREEFVA